MDGNLEMGSGQVYENEHDSEPCIHEWVEVEYLSQLHGHCSSCNCTVIKNGDGKWVYP